MDTKEILVFDGKTLADLFKEIYFNSVDKREKIHGLIEDLRPFIKNIGDAAMLVPIIKEYMDVSVKNDDLLIKMAGIIQRSLNSNQGSEDLLLSDADKEMLFESIQQLDNQSKEQLPIIENVS